MRSEEAQLAKEVEEKTARLKKLRAILKAAEGDVPNYPWTGNALSCITGKGEFVTSLEILECLFWDSPEELEGGLNTKRKYIVSLSVALNNLCNNGKLSKVILKGHKGHFYGLPEWLQEDGKLKPEYEEKLRVKAKTVTYKTTVNM